MTVLKNPGGSVTDEVASVDARVEGRERPAAQGLRLSTTVCFGIALLTFVLASMAGSAGVDGLGRLLFVAAAVLIVTSTLVAIARALVGLVTMIRVVAGVEDGSFVQALAKVVGNGLWAAFGTIVAYLGTVGFSRGRQLRRRGRVLLPTLRGNAEWTDLAIALDAAEAPAGLADQWRENGKTEHASVAAFARLTLDLMALGAPPRLVAAANRDALDEIRHAELCFSLATALDGKRISPAPFPEAQRVATLARSRPLALARLAVSSLVDGALHEGVSARIIARLAKRAGVPAIRETLRSIAADEGRHSAHGWDVVEWCVAEGGAGVREALLGALRALPPRMATNLPAGAADGGWERWGIHGHALEAEEYGEALAHLAERVRALVAASPRRAA